MTFYLSNDSLDWALAHIHKYSDTDIFPRPFEIDAITHEWGTLKDYLAGQDLDTWKARPKRVCLTPKGRYAFRASTQLDPLDSLIYAALIYEAGPALESFRMPAGDEIVLSHRFAPGTDGQLYDRAFGWTRFMERCRDLASQGSVDHVIVADIADFFHRIYHHRMENMLGVATTKSDQARVLTKLIRQWSGGPSYGIPIGPSPSRLIAEVTLDDIDNMLRSEGATFCRYSDDYRVFCSSLRDGYEKLSRLADLLYRSHGLTLAPGKTRIVPTDVFLEHYLSSPESEELTKLNLTFEELLAKLGLQNRYEDINYDELEPELQELVDQLNLEELLRQQLAAEELDIGLMRFVLRRLGQLNDHDVAVELVENAEHCYPVMASVVEYLHALRDVPSDVKDKVASRLMQLIESSTVAHLPYHRSWLLSLFARSAMWGQSDKLVGIHNGIPEPFTRRKAILAMGRAGQFFWFWAGRDSALALEPWLRRAFLAGASCLPADEGKYWYKSLHGNLDELEEAVVKWAKAYPFA